MHDSNRRQWLTLAGAGLSIALIGAPELRAAEKKEKEEEMEVSAVEDLMREHGVLRRALLVYAEASSRLVHGKSDIPLAPLGATASLFRRFGEEYHERSLEEQHVFVPLIKAGGPNASLARTLTAQHERGRQITDYIAAMAKKGRIAPADVTPFSNCLADFVRMYQHHAAIEDTVIFPAWKASISSAQYDELNEEFEELEHKMFGKDGFEDAVKQIASIEQSFGLADLGALTAAVPPPAG
jgi:hemerythrin-like domain-containing protein